MYFIPLISSDACLLYYLRLYALFPLFSLLLWYGNTIQIRWKVWNSIPLLSVQDLLFNSKNWQEFGADKTRTRHHIIERIYGFLSDEESA